VVEDVIRPAGLAHLSRVHHHDPVVDAAGRRPARETTIIVMPLPASFRITSGTPPKAASVND
jgi:hypothetical protein